MAPIWHCSPGEPKRRPSFPPSHQRCLPMYNSYSPGSTHDFSEPLCVNNEIDREHNLMLVSFEVLADALTLSTNKMLGSLT
jgi:hypothetical protein